MNSGIKFDITDAGLKDMVAEALLSAMNSETRNSIIKDALVYLVTERKDNNFRTIPSPLLEAFHSAMLQVARELARDYIHNTPDVLEQVRSMMVDAFARVFVTNRDATVDRVADALLKSFGPDSRY